MSNKDVTLITIELSEEQQETIRRWAKKLECTEAEVKQIMFDNID